VFTKTANIAVVGMGVSGNATAKWLAKNGFAFSLHDSRAQLKLAPDVASLAKAVFLGEFKAEDFAGCAHIVLSPGLDPNTPFFQKLKKDGVHFSNDISLFGEVAQKPIIGITGSNGKSTVTALTGEILARAGMNVGVGGNLGTAALDLLDEDADAYVVELSSFQLEVAQNLPLHAATLLNLSPDHLDRHKTMSAYHACKQNIFACAQTAVVNREDPLSNPNRAMPKLYFGLDAPENAQGFGIKTHNGEAYLCAGEKPVLPVAKLKIQGQHNQLNALAAMALSATLGVPTDVMAEVLAEFTGLPHRAQLVMCKNAITWINDSKGTNTGATLATFAGLSANCEGKMILVLGGQGKGEDYSVLQTVVSQCRAVLLMGEEAPVIQKAIASCAVPQVACQNLSEVVQMAKHHAQPGDCVLFSPACTSLDMFENYKARGDAFMECVKQNA